MKHRVEFQNGAQVSGRLTNILLKNNEPAYLQFTGPCQVSYLEKELELVKNPCNQNKIFKKLGKEKEKAKIKMKLKIKFKFKS